MKKILSLVMILCIGLFNISYASGVPSTVTNEGNESIEKECMLLPADVKAIDHATVSITFPNEEVLASIINKDQFEIAPKYGEGIVTVQSIESIDMDSKTVVLSVNGLKKAELFTVELRVDGNVIIHETFVGKSAPVIDEEPELFADAKAIDHATVSITFPNEEVLASIINKDQFEIAPKYGEGIVIIKSIESIDMDSKTVVLSVNGLKKAELFTVELRVEGNLIIHETFVGKSAPVIDEETMIPIDVKAIDHETVLIAFPDQKNLASITSIDQFTIYEKYGQQKVVAINEIQSMNRTEQTLTLSVSGLEKAVLFNLEIFVQNEQVAHETFVGQ